MSLDQIQVELQETMGSDRAIANAAWTSSFDKVRRDVKSDEQVGNLVKRLIIDGHGVPIESVIFKFWMRIPIFTDRQHMTHRLASHNGLSGRYRTMPEDWYKLPEDVQDILDTQCIGMNSAGIQRYERVCQIANEHYRQYLSELKEAQDVGNLTNEQYKRCREVLRGMLPQAGMTERTTIMNLRSFANYQRQRNSSHAQPEIKRVAELMLEQVKAANVCPVAIATLEEREWLCHS